MRQASRYKSVFIKGFRWVLWLVLIVLGFYVNRELQSYWGREALKQTGLTSLPLAEALSKAQVEQKRVLADMSAIWCPTCRKLDQQVFANNKVQSIIKQHFVFARIEYDSAEGKHFMQKYAVQGFPTILVLSAQGEKIRAIPLTFDPVAYAKLLSSAADIPSY
jgi:thiol:disulfide interchange protein